MQTKLFSFPGGVKPEGHKQISNLTPIRSIPLPKQLVLPLRTSARAITNSLVAVGQKVLKGQVIASADSQFATPLHAPTSGTVIAIEDRPLPHPSMLSAVSIVIEPDGEERWAEIKPFNLQAHDTQTVLAYLRNCGIVGLGGATFPSHMKMYSIKDGDNTTTTINTLIINGSECEPWITCDDLLMREHAREILTGARLVAQVISAKTILVGIEDNKPQALQAMQAAKEELEELESQLEIIPIPSLYPAGGEKQLIKTLTGIEIPHGKLGPHFGVQCFNVGTVYAVYRAITFGEPLLSRVVTITGNVEKPGNYEVLIGTSIEHLLSQASPRNGSKRLLIGGPMMGIELRDQNLPLLKGINCLLVADQKILPPSPAPMPCIRCGACAQACPVILLPFEMYWYSHAKIYGKAQEYNIFDCIECGCCSYVCPSHIPLVDYFRHTKSEIWAREQEKAASNVARQRYEFRLEREERNKREKEARLAAKAVETKAKLASGDKQKIINAALERNLE